MKFSLSWLKDHLETDAPPSLVAETLTRIGLEVESVTNPAELLGPFRIARVLTARPHPQADKLQVLTVDTGDGEPLQVVCGAPNAREGLVGVFGGAGTFVPGSNFTLGKATIRGVESNGMMCSARELMLGEDHDGIIELPVDAPVGQGYAAWAGLDDAVFDVAITPNRPDCMGVNGIARDLAAAGLGHLRHPSYAVVAGSFAPDQVGVTVEPGSGCSIFWRRIVRGVTNGPSPEWLQRRLKAAGLRPISALVDITNFFSMDQARPLHVYDIAKLHGNIRVRRGRDGDRFLALNGKEYAPTPDDIVIADDGGAIGLGGVIGGERTGVDEDTTDVLLECALFDPATIALTGQRHGIVSDARARFERGVDPQHAGTAIETATQMILDLTGGEPSEPRISGAWPADGYPNVLTTLVHQPSLVETLGGLAVEPQEQLAILGRLGFLAVNIDDPDSWTSEEERLRVRTALDTAEPGSWPVRVPTWRPDIDGSADLVEEILRIAGYDRIPSTALPRASGVARPTATPAQLAERRLRRAAAARGLDEVVTWSFIPERDAAAFGGASAILANPISEEMKAMRPSLLPGLIRAAHRNLDRGAASVRLFELGRRYREDGEHRTAAVLLAGERDPRQWHSGKAQGFDPFDAKAEALALLEAAGAPVGNLQLTANAGPAWHPGRSARLGLGKTVLAEFGELHPALAKTFDVPPGFVGAELFLDAIPARRASGRTRPAFAPPPLQPVRRDFAFFVPADLPADALLRAIRGADKAAITAARLFDRFASDAGLSLAVEVTLQPAEKSFTDAEIAEIGVRVVVAAEKLGARLRG